MQNARLWIAITRPDSLVDALAVAALCKRRFSSCHLLYEESSWWQRTRWENYRPLFDGITAFAKVKTCRGVIDLPRFYRELVGRQRRLRALEITPRDAVVCLAGVVGLANAIASAYPEVPKALVVTKKKYDDSSRAPDARLYRHTTSSWFQFHLLEPLAGVRRTIQLKPRRRQGGDGVRITRLEQPLEAVFQAVVILSNTGRELPPGAGPNLFAAPFPNLNDFVHLLPRSAEASGAAEPRRVVFFGTPFLLVQNLPPDQYAAILNRCLDYLRHCYGGRCRLIYRPHPAETREREHLRLEDFTFEDDQEVAQLYFLKHFSALEAVFSVSSTVSRVALNNGLNGYALWRCFPFGPEAAAYFETLMGVTPPPFDIRSLDEPPQPYAARGSAARQDGGFAGTLERALHHVIDLGGEEKAVASRPEIANK
jgi:hypothetical protein